MGGAKREFTAKEKLWIGMGMTFGFMLVEAIGGFYARSLAMLGDAAHMLTDAASFGVSLAAIYLSERGPTKNYTFGLARVEVLAALASTMGIWLVTGALVWEAVLRIDEFYAGTAAPVDGKLMVVLGLFGVSMNVVLERVLGGHHHGGFGHDHGHGHAHGHGHCCGGHGHDDHDHHADHRDHGHGHGHHSSDDEDEKDHGHGHGHGHGAPPAPDGHDHGHGHAKAPDHDHGHGHAKTRDDRDDHGDHGHGHGHEKTRLAPAGGASYSALGAEAPPPKKEKRNMNLDAAYLHVLGDLLQSLGVVVAGLLIWAHPDWQVADPVVTLVFAVVVLYTTAGFTIQTVTVLLQGAPDSVDCVALTRALNGLDGVADCHDVHVWELTAGKPILSCHMICAETTRDPDAVLKAAQALCASHGIDHATIQIQTGGDCLSTTCCASYIPPAGVELV